MWPLSGVWVKWFPHRGYHTGMGGGPQGESRGSWIQISARKKGSPHGPLGELEK